MTGVVEIRPETHSLGQVFSFDDVYTWGTDIVPGYLHVGVVEDSMLHGHYFNLVDVIRFTFSEGPKSEEAEGNT